MPTPNAMNSLSKKPLAVVLHAAFAIVLTSIAVYANAQVEYVDPTIGNVGVLLVPTRPTVYMPNSMIRVYPIRSDAMDDQIESFPLTINSHRIQELFSLMPGDEGQTRRLRSGNADSLLLLCLPRRFANPY